MTLITFTYKAHMKSWAFKHATVVSVSWNFFYFCLLRLSTLGSCFMKKRVAFSFFRAFHESISLITHHHHRVKKRMREKLAQVPSSMETFEKYNQNIMLKLRTDCCALSVRSLIQYIWKACPNLVLMYLFNFFSFFSSFLCDLQLNSILALIDCLKKNLQRCKRSLLFAQLLFDWLKYRWSFQQHKKHFHTHEPTSSVISWRRRSKKILSKNIWGIFETSRRFFKILSTFLRELEEFRILSLTCDDNQWISKMIKNLKHLQYCAENLKYFYESKRISYRDSRNISNMRPNKRWSE